MNESIFFYFFAPKTFRQWIEKIRIEEKGKGTNCKLAQGGNCFGAKLDRDE